MEIKIESNYLPLFHLTDDLPEGVKLLHAPPLEVRYSCDVSAIVSGVLSFSSGVAASVLAAWIYDKFVRFKDKKELILIINKITVKRISKEEITKIIEDTIKTQKK